MTVCKHLSVQLSKGRLYCTKCGIDTDGTIGLGGNLVARIPLSTPKEPTMSYSQYVLTPIQRQVMDRLGWTHDGTQYLKIDQITKGTSYAGSSEWYDDLARIEENPYCMGDLRQPVYEVEYVSTRKIQIGGWTREEAREAFRLWCVRQNIEALPIHILPTNITSILMDPTKPIDTNGD